MMTVENLVQSQQNFQHYNRIFGRKNTSQSSLSVAIEDYDTVLSRKK